MLIFICPYEVKLEAFSTLVKIIKYNSMILLCN